MPPMRRRHHRCTNLRDLRRRVMTDLPFGVSAKVKRCSVERNIGTERGALPRGDEGGDWVDVGGLPDAGRGAKPWKLTVMLMFDVVLSKMAVPSPRLCAHHHRDLLQAVECNAESRRHGGVLPCRIQPLCMIRISIATAIRPFVLLHLGNPP